MSIMLQKKVSRIQICDTSEKIITGFDDVIMSTTYPPWSNLVHYIDIHI